MLGRENVGRLHREMLLQRLQWRTCYPSWTRKKKILCNYFPFFCFFCSLASLLFLPCTFSVAVRPLYFSLEAFVWLRIVTTWTRKLNIRSWNLRIAPWFLFIFIVPQPWWVLHFLTAFNPDTSSKHMRCMWKEVIMGWEKIGCDEWKLVGSYKLRFNIDF